MRVQAIINPISGVGSKRKIPKLIEQMCKENNDDVAISFTEYIGHASILTKEALSSGAECILAVGGDGTVNEIARAMLHTEAVLGIIPKGSGNGLARELHIPMEVRRALAVIRERNSFLLYLRSWFRCSCESEICPRETARLTHLSQEYHRGISELSSRAIRADNRWTANPRKGFPRRMRQCFAVWQ